MALLAYMSKPERGFIPPMPKSTRIAAIEAGGTKFMVGVGHPESITANCTRIATLSPEETLPQLLDYLRAEHKKEAFSAIGVGSFGPLGVDPSRSNFGVIGPTTKPRWSQVSYPAVLSEFEVPLAITTDVNAAAMAEASLGAARDCGRVIYVTIGTGIGGGIVINGQVNQGTFHPEIGHMRIMVNPEDPMPEGVCAFHGNCLEGLASGPAIEKRWQANLSSLGETHLSINLQANYLAQMCMNLLLTMTPDVIILGGGVMETPSLLAKVRQELQTLMQQYLPQFTSEAAIQTLIRAPEHRPYSGLIGAALLAQGIR